MVSVSGPLRSARLGRPQWLVGLVLVLAFPLASRADEVQQQIQAHLAAGEFAPACALAESAPAATRDRLLADVAGAQAAAGLHRGSVFTTASISDDQVRSQTLERIRQSPVQSRQGAGGGSQADFDPLINLITSTVEPDSWDLVGGPGAIEPFPSGVYVDASGLMKRIQPVASTELAAVHRAAALANGNQDIRKSSALRKVSLTRLEKELQIREALGLPPTDAMRALAGIYRIQYVLVYPETGDLVIAGPAGDWHTDAEGRRIHNETGQPVLHLDDFVVVLRNALAAEGRFDCSIRPTQEALARTQSFLNESSRQPLRPSQRDSWLKQLRETLGKQEIEVNGIDSRTRVARVIVEADYRMKLVGMGLEEGVPGVRSYLEQVTVGPDGALPPMEVLRWWFTLNYKAVQATPEHRAFALEGQGVKVLSENELLTERGERVHTGKADELNREFARSFTEHFPQLAAKYPIYAELRNVFDLALIAALIRSEDLAGQVGWDITYFGTEQQFSGPRYQVELGSAPTHVETVINHRVINRKHIVAGVSGGVIVHASAYVKPEAIQTDDYGALSAEHKSAQPKELPRGAWWWD